MTMLIKIGNSQGIRIPKSLIKKAKLEDSVIDLEIVEDGLLLRPIKKCARENWSKNIEQILEKNQNKNDSALLDDFLDDSDLEDYKW